MSEPAVDAMPDALHHIDADGICPRFFATGQCWLCSIEKAEAAVDERESRRKARVA